MGKRAWRDFGWLAVIIATVACIALFQRADEAEKGATPPTPVQSSDHPVVTPSAVDTVAEETVNERDSSVLIKVPGGTFTMGSNDDDSEKPPHSVTLAPYWIGKYEVTNAQYRRFVKASGRSSTGWMKYAGQWGEQAPAVCVSWNDAVAYCAWAGGRLPTEAEWELAARGTGGRKFPWGNWWWFGSRCRCSPEGGDIGQPLSVGSYPSGASPYGCLDMAGNVWEWCASKYRPYPYNPRDGREDAGGSDARVLRGGGWHNFIDEVFSSAYRIGNNPTGRWETTGFRLARRH